MIVAAIITKAVWKPNGYGKIYNAGIIVLKQPTITATRLAIGPISFSSLLPSEQTACAKKHHASVQGEKMLQGYCPV